MISCLRTIAKAVQQIRAGALTSVELVELCLAQVDRFEPTIGPWELVDHHGACHEAIRLDQLARKGQIVGLLHGIPIPPEQRRKIWGTLITTDIFSSLQITIVAYPIALISEEFL